jgi:hypothetical protein
LSKRRQCLEKLADICHDFYHSSNWNTIFGVRVEYDETCVAFSHGVVLFELLRMEGDLQLADLRLTANSSISVHTLVTTLSSFNAKEYPVAAHEKCGAVEFMAALIRSVNRINKITIFRQEHRARFSAFDAGAMLVGSAMWKFGFTAEDLKTTTARRVTMTTLSTRTT